MRVVWSERASRELDEILAWILNDSQQKALLVSQRVVKSALLLEEFPYAGRAGRLKRFRELVVPKSGYVLFYTVKTDHLEIVSIRRGKRRKP